MLVLKLLTISINWLEYEHFYVQVPKDNVVREDKLASTLGEMRTTAEVFERG